MYPNDTPPSQKGSGGSLMTTMTATPNGIQLLNASYEVLSENYAPQKAARLLSLGKATIQEGDPTRSFGEWIYPKVLRLVKMVRLPYDLMYGVPRVTKRQVLVRDLRTCAYCLGFADSIDHVHPRSKGGENTWENLVAACKPCNHKKGNKLLSETNMKLQWEGYVPTRTQLK
jgi:hypothetical protein